MAQCLDVDSSNDAQSTNFLYCTSYYSYVDCSQFVCMACMYNRTHSIHAHNFKSLSNLYASMSREYSVLVKNIEEGRKKVEESVGYKASCDDRVLRDVMHSVSEVNREIDEISCDLEKVRIA